MPNSTPATPATGTTGTPETGEPTGTPAAGAPAEDTPATGTDSPATGDSDSTPSLTPEQIQALVASNARREAALREANSEAQKRREQAKEAERAKMTAEEAAKAELDELKAKAEEWEVERASLFLENEVSKISAKMGVIDPDVVVRLIDWDDLEFEDGRPTNVEKVVKDLVADKQYLIGKAGQSARPTGINSGSGQGEQSKVNLTAQEMQAATDAGITPERYQALKGVSTLDDWLQTRKTGQGN